MALRTADPPEWSIGRCLTPNNAFHTRMYKGWVRTIRYMCENDWDWPIIVTGLEGTGKSAFALNLARDLDDGITPENLREHVIWDLDDDFIAKIVRSRPSVFVLDEAGVDLFSRDFMKEKVKEIIRLVILMRQFNHILIIVLPKLKWLDSYLRDHRVNNWVDVGWFGGSLERVRGRATVYISLHHPMGSVPFWKKMFTVRFPNYPIDIEDEYRRQKRLYTEERFSNKKAVLLSHREAEVLAAKERGLKNMDIARYYKVSPTAVKKWIDAAQQKLDDYEKDVVS